jgi:hypothetical protein
MWVKGNITKSREIFFDLGIKIYDLRFGIPVR